MAHSHPSTLYELGENDVIGAALVAPGFVSDLTTWWLTISNEGLITQQVRKQQPPKYKSELITLKRQLSDVQLASVCEILKAIGFLDFGDEYSCSWTSLEDTKVVARIGNQSKNSFFLWRRCGCPRGRQTHAGIRKTVECHRRLSAF